MVLFYFLNNKYCVFRSRATRVKRSLFPNDEWIDHIPPEDRPMRVTPTFKENVTGLTVPCDDFDIHDFINLFITKELINTKGMII